MNAMAATATASTSLPARTFSSARPVAWIAARCLPRRAGGESMLSPSPLRFSAVRTRRAEAARASAAGAGGAPAAALPAALLFDCDGVLVDTEKDGHRISFNETFAERELGVSWDVELYGELLKIGGGKERLIDEALGKGVKVAEKITIFAGDVVPRKKPDPAIYLLAATTLEVDPSSCVVVEDSNIGLSAAKAAGMKCIVTKSGYTADEDFVIADAVFDCIGDPPEGRFDLEFCANLLQKQFVS
ncbi:unnamed protein product [Triticum turgidum subsp. durum]|uniref:Uncharacterized protein n=1 Tax=Triticum turgidum subsp. durum TaxID=4567 RepID=A0A9R1C2L1_TRITD|nr:unnamed protein product [Triticum turgidum subsp. durum]